MKRIGSFLLAAALVVSLAGCGSLEPTPSQGQQEEVGGTTNTVLPNSEMFTDRDLAGTYENAVAVDLSGGSFTVTEAGTYRFTGSLTEGGITVDVADKNAKVQLVLDGVDISVDNGAAICVLGGDKVFLTLAEGSENSLTATALDDTIDATIYSKSDLTINGSGSLTVSAPGGHGISCKDDLVITGGNLTVTAASHALDANDSVRICGGTLTLSAGKDGIHAENTDDAALGFVYLSGGTLAVDAQGDGISAGSYLHLLDGEMNILSGGGWENGEVHSSDGFGQMPGGRPGERPGGMGKSTTSTTQTDDATSMKGIKAVTDIIIAGGALTIDSADDAIHSDGSLTVSGGEFAISSGDDAAHAETDLTVTDCTMTIAQCYEGLEAERIYVKGGEISINSSDDGLNASGGADSSGTEGGRDGMFGGGHGGMPGGMGANENATIDISGGSLTIYAGGDGVDSNGGMNMSGGYVYVTNPSFGDVSVLDSQMQPVITGGTYIGLGVSTMMAETFSQASTQGVIACCVNGRIPSGSRITVADEKGNVVMDVTAEYDIQLMILSCPELIKGETYTITAGTVTGELEAS